MINGNIVVRAMTVAALLTTGACRIVSDPPKIVIAQDVEFLRGCWVAKTAPGGEITAFLRLLPDSADALSYQGYVQVIANGEQTAPVHLSFARDGSSMTMRSASGRPVAPDDRGGLARPFVRLPEAVAARLPKAAHRVSYAAEPERPQSSWLTAEGDEETLAIHAIDVDGQKIAVLFEGERDGCD